MRLLYLFDKDPRGREADVEQAVKTAAALAGAGVAVVFAYPRAARRAAVTADELARHHDVTTPPRLLPVTVPGGGEVARKIAFALRVPALLGRFADHIVYTRKPELAALALALGRPAALERFRVLDRDPPPMRALLRAVVGHRRFAGLIAHSDLARRSFAGLSPHLVTAHNGTEPERFAGLDDRADLRARLGLPVAATIALYAGRLSATKGLDAMAALIARCPEVHFLLVGEHPPALAAAANVFSRPWQAPAALRVHLAAADILVIPPDDAPLYRHGGTVLPIKTFLYLAAGRAIVAPATPDIAEILSDGETALLVPPGDIAAAAQALARLGGERGLAARLGAAARARAGGLTWDARARRIVEFLAAR